MNDVKISRRVTCVPGALSIYINEIVYRLKREGNDVITLSLGEAFFDIPMFDMSKLDFVRGYHYSDSQGVPELRNEIAKFYGAQYGVPISFADEILVTAGSKAAIYMAFLATIDRDDEVLIHEPAWLSYQEQIRLVDGIPKFIPFDVPVNQFDGWISSRTKMLVINNPNNPAGKIYSSEELSNLVQICKSRGIWLLVDEAYSDFLYEGQFQSALSFDENREVVIVVNSLSKNMGMSGWRVGYMIANPILIKEVLKLNQHIITCAPTILQLYLAEYFRKLIAITLPQAVEVVKKRTRISQKLDELNLPCLSGTATFYFFVDTAGFPVGSLELSLYLLLCKNIAVAPGLAYGPSVDRFIRISIGTESEERIADALSVIKDVLHAPPENIISLINARLAELGIDNFKQVKDNFSAP